MTHKVLMMGRHPARHREVVLSQRVLSQQLPGLETMFLESDDPAELASKLAVAEFVIAVEFTAEHLAMAPKLKLIQHSGVGYEQIDVDAAFERGVPVALTPEGTIPAVAEHVIMLILGLYRHLVQAHNALTRGEWIHKQLRAECLMLEGKTLGIIGIGRTGREVLRRAQPFDVRPIYHDLRQLPAEEEKRLGIEYRSLDKLISEADIVTLHVFLSEGSRGLIGERELNLMKPTAILINTSRGDVVEEAALYRALKERRIAGAGIDVFEEEPTPSDNPLLRLENVLLTPHLAGGTLDSMRQKARAQYENFRRVIDGRSPINLAQPYSQVESGIKGRKT